MNRYTVSREGQKSFFIDPTRRRAERNVMPPSDGGGLRGSVIRWIGLALALGIMAVALVEQLWIFVLMGLVLAMVYGLRINQARAQKESLEQRQADRLQQMIALQQAPKWIRFIRFGSEFIEVEDPERFRQYKYGQIERATQDRAYITLWMDDDTQVRVYKDGFIIGTLEGFEPFIEKKINIMTIPEQAAPAGEGNLELEGEPPQTDKEASS
ncbi:MAG: hypothetical protein HDQ87_02410 [Clostridia bacterium]|nr:hypothetical protein [Clostridia bacterium]